MEEHRSSPRRRRVWIFGIVSVVLATFLTVTSVNNQRPQDPACQGLAGAGFPVTFVCDSVGSSPTSSWGKIDAADMVFPNPLFWLDVLFYTVLLWLPWLIVRGISHRIRQRRPPRQVQA
jgi:hypothetical protein